MKRRLPLVLGVVMLLVAALGAWGYLTEHNRASDARMDLARTRSQLRVQSAVARRLAERQSDSEAAFDAHLRRLQRRIRELEHPRLARIGTQVRLSDGPFSVPLWMLAPYDAFITNGRPLAAWGSIPPQVVLTWRRGASDFPPRDTGLFIWQATTKKPSEYAPFTPQYLWRVAYEIYIRPWTSARIGPPDDLRNGTRDAESESFTSGDVTGDGYPDFLVKDDTDGSGGCGVWRVLMNEGPRIEEIFHRHTCDTGISITHGRLAVDAAAFPKGCEYAHGCGTRHTLLEWNGNGWDVVSRHVTIDPYFLKSRRKGG